MWGKRDDMVVHESEPYNAEPPPSALLAARTPVDAFYVRNHGGVPEVDVAAWRLQVGGAVATPLELSLDELSEWFATVTIEATLQCAGNRRAGLMDVKDISGQHPWGPAATSNASWTGARLADVLAAAEVTAEAGHVWFSAPDVAVDAVPRQPYGGSIPLAKAMSDEVLLAWAMNDEPLAPVHGYPLRVVVPGWIGARSVKWLESITVSTQASDNYFQRMVYRLLPADADPDRSGPGYGHSLSSVALNCEILQPAAAIASPATRASLGSGPVGPASVAAGTVRVAGYAYAGDDRTVIRVDVSTDGGASWRPAELDEGTSPWTWQQWRLDVELAPGEAEIVARAWDSTGALQPSSAADLWNPKGYLNNSWPRLRVTAQ